jgi:Steigviridae/Suoliviridae L,D-carboxypeptidase/transpeptidase
VILLLQRDAFLPNGTTGRLSVDGREFCFTLEPAKETRITDGPVCVPAGSYPVTIDFSPRFRRAMPRVLNVPGRDGILLHWGNYVENTEGCILVGSSKSMIQGAAPEPAVWDSRETFGRLYREIEEAQAEGVVLTIRDALPIAQHHEMRASLSDVLKER